MTDAPPFPDDVRERIAAGTFLLVDKPRGPTSHQVTSWVRDLLGLEKAGHAGTLDPNVSGLLWVGVGPALKLLPLMLEFPKHYIAVVTLHGPAPASEVERVIAEFRGPIYQTPPVRSAVRRERRVRTIHRLDRLEQRDTQILLDIVADSGTYVRTLAVDLGDALGVGGHMEELRRVGTGPFRESQSLTLTSLADAVERARAGESAALLSMLHPIDEVWKEFPSLVLKDGAASAVVHGADLASGGIRSIPRPFGKDARVVLVSGRGEILAFGTSLFTSEEIPRQPHGWVVDSERVLADPARFPPAWGKGRTPKPSSTEVAPDPQD